MTEQGADARRRRRASSKRLRNLLGPHDPAQAAPCHYCGVATVVVPDRAGVAMPADARTRDHVVPLSAGGKNEPWNIVIACRACNRARRDRDGSCRCEFCEAARERHRRAAVAS